MKYRIALICATVIGALLVLFTLSGQRKGTVVVVDVEQVVKGPQAYQGRDLRVRGFIKPGSVSRYGEKADFVLMHGKGELAVHFDGSSQLPDTFADGAPARADGRLQPGLRLVSNKVEAKCASKYDASKLEQGAGKAGTHPHSIKQDYTYPGTAPAPARPTRDL